MTRWKSVYKVKGFYAGNAKTPLYSIPFLAPLGINNQSFFPQSLDKELNLIGCLLKTFIFLFRWIVRHSFFPLYFLFESCYNRRFKLGLWIPSMITGKKLTKHHLRLYILIHCPTPILVSLVHLMFLSISTLVKPHEFYKDISAVHLPDS